MALVITKRPSAIVIGIGFFAITVLAFRPLIDPLPRLIWNASDSIPKGLYVVANQAPAIGDIAVLKLPEWALIIADQRRYLPRNAWLLKPVAASNGDIVCRFGLYIFVNGKIVATALKQDKSGRDLPLWKGCKTLRVTEIFVLSKHRDSFDGRYFGSASIDLVIGTAKPLSF